MNIRDIGTGGVNDFSPINGPSNTNMRAVQAQKNDSSAPSNIAYANIPPVEIAHINAVSISDKSIPNNWVNWPKIF